MKLANFYRVCRCGKSIKFDDTNELKECDNCKRILRIPPKVISYLINRKEKQNATEQLV